MSKIEKVLATGKTHTTMHQDTGSARGAHGRVDMALTSPGNAKLNHDFVGVVAHPTAEQLFAGAWSACYISAIGVAAQEQKITLEAGLTVDIEVDLGQTGDDYFLQARFNVKVPGVSQDIAEKLAHRAHEICPYSKGTKGNVDVTMNVTNA